MSHFETHYENLKTAANKNSLFGPEVAETLCTLCSESTRFVMENLAMQEAVSSVPEKKYGLLVHPDTGKRSRPINIDLFEPETARAFIDEHSLGDIGDLPVDKRQKVLYSLVVSFCASNDILKSNDRKSPGTFFEIFIGHIFASTYQVEPMKHIQVLNLDADSKLPTDYIFDLGPEKSKLHLPVKLSTRERVIQVWAHQRVLDGVFGAERFKGVLVSLAETNYQVKSNSVVEVCLPKQWAVYQMFIARMFRVYYLDMPQKYLDLAKEYPFIQVRPFSAFFEESEGLIGPPEAT